jgi:hypothetical protein
VVEGPERHVEPRGERLRKLRAWLHLIDEVYRIRDGTGVSVGAPQFGPRRGVFAGVKKEL